jgi:hypothetical protein
VLSLSSALGLAGAIGSVFILLIEIFAEKPWFHATSIAVCLAGCVATYMYGHLYLSEDHVIVCMLCLLALCVFSLVEWREGDDNRRRSMQRTVLNPV